MAPRTSLFEFKLDLLKNELATIGESIRKLDDASMKIKNWAILIWAGSISVVLGSKEADLRKLLIIIAIIPILFWLVDGNCRRRQRHFIFRNQKISNFINSPEFTTTFETQNFGEFNFMKIMAGHNESDEVRDFTALKKIMWYGSLRNFYIGLVAITAILQFFLYPKNEINSSKKSNTDSDSIFVYQQKQVLEELIKLNSNIDSLLTPPKSVSPKSN